MRRLLFVVAIAGCSHAGASGPQWPKSAASEHDGGESIAPRDGAKSVAAAKDDSDDDAAPVAEAAPAAGAAPAAVTEGGAPAAAAPATSDDVIQTEEIVIEIGPDD